MEDFSRHSPVYEETNYQNCLEKNSQEIWNGYQFGIDRQFK